MNKSFKAIAAVLVAVGLLTATYKAGQSSISQDSKGDLRAKQELFDLTQKDFEEYQNLKSLEDRYKKADEILGKIMTVFLADLGLRLGYKPVSAAELEAACGIPGLAAAPTIIPAGAVKSEAISTQPVSASPSPAPTVASTGNEWLKNEAALLALRDERTALDELRKMEIKDVVAAVKSSGTVGVEDALRIEGNYRGTISFFDHKAHKADWSITWDVGILSRQPLEASMEITLTDKGTGKRFSRSRTKSGPLKDFMKVPGSKGLIVNVYADDGFIQIYPLNGDTQTWVGNYYERVQFGSYAIAGQVTLSK